MMKINPTKIVKIKKIIPNGWEVAGYCQVSSAYMSGYCLAKIYQEQNYKN